MQFKEEYERELGDISQLSTEGASLKTVSAKKVKKSAAPKKEPPQEPKKPEEA